jgi:hypothetical protein
MLETSIRDEKHVADRSGTLVLWVLLLKYKNVGIFTMIRKKTGKSGVTMATSGVRE